MTSDKQGQNAAVCRRDVGTCSLYCCVRYKNTHPGVNLMGNTYENFRKVDDTYALELPDRILVAPGPDHIPDISTSIPYHPCTRNGCNCGVATLHKGGKGDASITASA